MWEPRYISEIMPLRVRGKAVGLCTAMNWGPANVFSAFLPLGHADLGGGQGDLVRWVQGRVKQSSRDPQEV